MGVINTSKIPYTGIRVINSLVTNTFNILDLLGLTGKSETNTGFFVKSCGFNCDGVIYRRFCCHKLHRETPQTTCGSSYHQLHIMTAISYCIHVQNIIFNIFNICQGLVFVDFMSTSYPLKLTSVTNYESQSSFITHKKQSQEIFYVTILDFFFY